MTRLIGVPFPVFLVFLSFAVTACGGGGDAGGPDGGVARFCETDAECEAGLANECQLATCEIIAGVCESSDLPDGTACNDDSGVCRDGFCAPTELKAFVKSPFPEPNAKFGTSVSLLGDRMIVGAPGSSADRGTVAAFERVEGEWKVDTEIESKDVAPSCPKGIFGWSVASAKINGTPAFVVGSVGFGVGGFGSARLFRLLPNGWTEDTTYGCLFGSDTQRFDLFGTSLAMTPSGETVVVGAPGRTRGGGLAAFSERTFSGGAYVFERINSAQWEEAAILEASNAGGNYECSDQTGEGDGFGTSVAVWGDIEGEINTVVVGAPGEASSTSGVALDTDGSNDDAPGAGAAYVFERMVEIVDTEEVVTWEQTAYLKASNTNAGDRFGFAVAIHGDTIVVGAEREDSGDVNNQGDNSAIEAGAAYVFERSAESWAQTQYLKASNVAAGYFFGANLTMSDTTLVVGSPGEGSIGGMNSGAAYVFTYDDGAWAQSNFYKAFNADADSAFAGPPGSIAYGTPSIENTMCPDQLTTKGASLSLDGDTLAVGTPYEDSQAVGVNGVPTSNEIKDSGAVYIFENDEP